MALGWWYISVTYTLSNQFTMHNSLYYKIGILFQGNSSKSGKSLSLQKKNIRIMVVHNPEPHVEVYFNN